jgi:hypothetical protein
LKRGLLLLAPLCLLSACAGPPGSPQNGGDAVQVVLENVRVRQYIQDRLSFEFVAPRVVLDKQNEVIRAPDGVQGKIEDSLWEELEK